MDGDTDSLFGSPPPSPNRGRSSSPRLALPTGQSQGLSTQNVGTIALPGSQHHSELPVTPLALSLSHPANSPAVPISRPTARSAISTTPSSSRASSSTPAAPARKKRSRVKSTTTPLTPRPEIVLPGPSDPVPAHFLRNNSALLGTAGLVAGVRPNSLPNRHCRGTTPSNPIVVEDEESTPTAPKPMCPPHQFAGGIDPGLLPAPSTQDIVAMLVGQRDIFPVLEGILRLISGTPSQAYTQPPRSFRAPPAFLRKPQEGAPPLKRRKLNRVPAGAVDWDVPYPFKQGEGPKSYRSTWEQERGRDLLSQLMDLIKEATQKAAAKNYLQSLQSEQQRRAFAARVSQAAPAPAVGSFVTPSPCVPIPTPVLPQEADTSPGSSTIATEKTAPEVSLPSPHPVSNSGPTKDVEQPPTPFDRLITSLLTATPQHISLPPSQTMPSSDPADITQAGANAFESIPANLEDNNPPLATSTDQAVFDGWMDILQSFPLPAEGLAQSNVQPSTLSEDFGNLFDFEDWNFDPSAPIIDFDALGLQASGDSFSQSQSSSMDGLIDPTLLALSALQPPPQNAPTQSSFGANSVRSTLPPSLTASPMPSAASSSYGEADPMTPNSAIWDLDSFGPLPRGSMEGSNMSFEEHNDHLLNQLVLEQAKQLSGVQVADLRGEIEDIGHLPSSRWKGKEREVPMVPISGGGQQPASVPSVSRSTTPNIASAIPAATEQDLSRSATPIGVQTSRTPIPRGERAVRRGSTAGGGSKDAILKSAREQRKWLSEELIKARTRLWETTIEQGVLAEFVKRCP